jgi:hypothetical protein
MALELSGSINISGSMTATTIIVSAPGAPGMVSSSNQLVELNTATGSLIGITNGLTAYTASLKGAIEVSGQNVNVLGTLTAQEIYTTYVTSSVMFKSGSTKFGNDTGDKHEFTGSVKISGSFEVQGTDTGATVGDLLVDSTNKYVYVGRQSVTSGDNTTLVLRDRTGTARATLPAGGSIDTIFTTNASNFRVTNYSGVDLFKIGNTGRAEVSGSFNVFGEIRMDGSTLFRGMSSNTLQLCGGTSSSNIKINGASEEITMDTNGVTRVTIATAGTVTSTGNVAAPSFYRTLTTQAIPFTTWTTVFDMNSIAGIFLFSVQLDGQDAADWAASGIVMSTGATSGVTAQYIGTQNDGTYIQTRISGTTFQAYQNGTNPTVTMNVRVFKIG